MEVVKSEPSNFEKQVRLRRGLPECLAVAVFFPVMCGKVLRRLGTVFVASCHAHSERAVASKMSQRPCALQQRCCERWTEIASHLNHVAAWTPEQKLKSASEPAGSFVALASATL